MIFRFNGLSIFNPTTKKGLQSPFFVSCSPEIHRAGFYRGPAFRLPR